MRKFGWTGRKSPADDTCRGSSAILVTSCSRLLRYERYERYGACGVRNKRRMGKPKPWACSGDGLGPTPRVPDRGTTRCGVSNVRRAQRQKTRGGQVDIFPDSQRSSGSRCSEQFHNTTAREWFHHSREYWNASRGFLGCNTHPKHLTYPLIIHRHTAVYPALH